MTPIQPMLCQEPKSKPPRLPDGDGWLMERKRDGWRFLFHVTGDGVRSYAGRNGSDRTGQPAEVEAALAFLPADTLLDAELVVPGQGAPAVSTALARGGVLQAVVFDILRVAGTDVTDLPLRERRALLDKAAEGFDGVNVMLSPAYALDEALHESWLAQGEEGSVCKRLDSVYRPGRRSWDWLKVKPQQTAEAIIVGFEEGKNGRAGEVGAFQVELLDSGIATTVGTSTDVQRAEVKAHPDRYLGHVIEFRHHGLLDSGKPRHPVFARMREDRDLVGGAA